VRVARLERRADQQSTAVACRATRVASFPGRKHSIVTSASATSTVYPMSFEMRICTVEVLQSISLRFVLVSSPETR
jgi:tetrahydromethanopterin S-methyltransferase subunit B